MTDISRPNLRRTFSPASPDGDEHSSVYRYILQRQGKYQDWTWLLASRVVVILDEAGAGKTAELQDQIGRLPSNTEGFFLRIERLCATELAKAFESEWDHRRFERWRASKREAVFFLDSVDEAKLPVDRGRNPLAAAIRAVDSALDTELPRVRFVISSRGSAWTPETELIEVRRLAERFRQSGVPKGDGDAPLEQFVRLDPLNGTQIESLAKWADAPEGFLETLDASGSHEFAQTPLDLLDLIASYRQRNATGQPGADIFRSLSVLTDDAIRRRASERGSDRARNQMAIDRTREGARRLAAACILGQTLAIQMPGSNGEGLDPFLALDGAGAPWTRAEVDQLLICGLFTAAWEGSVRFQHRRTMERLAAEAFDGVLRAGMPVRQLSDLLMPSAFGQITTPQPYVEMLSWLASLNDDFRREVLEQAPQLLIDMGDPGSHPVLVRQEALRRHVARYATAEWRGEWFDHRMLRRFSDPSLEGVCRELLGSAIPEEPKRMLLDLATLAGFQDCTSLILDIVGDRSASATLRGAAVEAAFSLAGAGALPRVRRAALAFRAVPGADSHVRHSNNRFRLAVVAFGRPHGLGLADALAILSRLERKGENWSPSTEYPIADAIAASAPSNRLGWLMKWLSRLCWSDDQRRFGSYDSPSWTPPGLYLLPALEAVVVRAIHERPDLHEDPLLIWNIDRLHDLGDMILGPLRRDEDDETRGALADAVRTTPRLRRVIFHRAVTESRKPSAADAGYLLERMSHQNDMYWSRQYPADDLDWMGTDYAAKTDDPLRTALVDAISCRLNVLPRAERARRRAHFIRAARHKADSEAVKAFAERRLQWFNRVRWKTKRFLARSRRRKLVRDLKARWAAIDLKARLIWSRKAVRSGEASSLLWRAIFGENWNHDDLAHLPDLHAPALVQDLVAGAKAFARRYDPPKGSRSLAAHLAAVGWSRIALDQPDALAALSEAEARRALRVARRARNWPGWADGLVGRHPAIWRDLLLPPALVEIGWRSPYLFYAEALSTAARQSEAFRLSIAGEVLAALVEAGAPEHPIISPAAMIIRTDAALRPELAALAARRFREHIAEGRVKVAVQWFLVWLEEDPASAWTALRQHHRSFGARSAVAVHDLLCLLGDAVLAVSIPAPVLADMARDYMRWITLEEDDDNRGDKPRSDAERARSNLPGRIAELTTPDARHILVELATDPIFADHTGWMTRVLERQAAAAAVPSKWSPQDVASFMGPFLRRPATGADLQALAVRHLEAIIADLAESEFDRRGLFREVGELDVRAFLAQALEARSQRWFTVTQEPVTASEKRTDLRLEGRSDADDILVVIVELKLARPVIWRNDVLVTKIETQLVDQYLISHKVRHGIYLVLEIGDSTHWTIDGETLDFDGLAEKMREKAAAVLATRPQVEGLAVVTGRIALPPKKARAKKRASVG